MYQPYSPFGLIMPIMNNKSPAIASGLFRRLFSSTILFAVCAVIISGCAGTEPARKQKAYPSGKTPATQRPYQIDGIWYYPIPDAEGYREKGIASWYGPGFDGKKTSNGETYDMYAMTAAHKTLPMGTHLEVRNIDNGKKTVVRINDRGPFVRKRIIDLSYTAAKTIGISGLGNVEISSLGMDKPPPKGQGPIDFTRGNFSIQVGAFQNRANADRLKKNLSSKYENAHVTEYDRGDIHFFRVRVGRYTSLKDAQNAEKNFIKTGFPDAMAVAE